MLSIGILTFTLIVYWMLVRRIFPSVLAPASVWLIGWSILFGVCAILGWGYIYKWDGVAVLMIGVMIFPIGCVLAAKSQARKVSPSLKRRWRAEFDWLAMVSPAIQLGAAALGVLSAIALSHHFGSPISRLSSFAEISLAAHANGALIESGEEIMPTYSSIAFGFLQIGFICSGILVASRGFWAKPGMLLVTLLIVVAMWTLVTTIRSYFVACVVWFACSYIATRICMKTERGFIKPRIILLCIVAFLGLAGLVIVSQSFRMGDYHFQLVGAAAAHLRPWAAGYISGFSCWYDEPTATAGGSNILRGIFSAFGIVKHEAFVRDITIIQIGSGQSTNAVTIFKTIIGELGTLGGMIFTLFFGYFSQRAYEWCHRGSLFGLAALSAVLAAILWSPNAWFFKYGSRIFAVLLVFCLFAAIRFVIDLAVKPLPRPARPLRGLPAG